MKIKTYCKDIDLDNYMHMLFNPRLNEITFNGVNCTERLYFPSTEKALEFYFEIIEAMYADAKELDLEHIPTSYEILNLGSFKNAVAERLKEYEPDEE